MNSIKTPWELQVIAAITSKNTPCFAHKYLCSGPNIHKRNI